MASSSTGDRVRLKMIANGASASREAVPTPTTLARLEDPRAWHARGEVGIQHPKAAPRDTGAIAFPMAPPLPKGRAIPVKKVVLEEEEYVERLGDIIEGDYFPHNAKMHWALAGLAQGTGIPGDSTPSGGGFVGTPSSVMLSTPGGSTSGLEDAGVGGAGRGVKAAGTGGALTSFVARHTSEDNQAFAELQEKDQEAFRRRYFWAYDTLDGEGNNATSTKLLILPDGKMMSVERRKQMDAACADRPKIGDHRPNQVETWKHRTRNQLMFSPNLVASQDTCRLKADPAPAAPLLLNGRNSVSRTAQRLIKQSGKEGNDVQRRVDESSAIDSAVESPGAVRKEPLVGAAAPTSEALAAEHSLVASEESGTIQQSRVEAVSNATAAQGAEGAMEEPLPTHNSDDDSSGNRSPPQQGKDLIKEAPAVPRSSVTVMTNPKVIQAHATRFPVPLARQPRRGPWASPIEKPSSSRESVAELLAGTADTSDYAEVPMTPSKVPGMDGDSPQITWGSIDGTPMILDPRATPLPDGSLAGTIDMASIVGSLGGSRGGHHFEIKELPPRDKLAHSLEAVDTRRKRAKLGLPAGGRGTRTPATPATPSTPRTPGTESQTPGTGRSSVGTKTPGKGRSRSSRSRAEAAAVATPSTPAARTLAAKLAMRQSVSTPFGGGLTPGRQRKRSGSKRGGSAQRDGVTPLPSTPGGVGGVAGSITPVVAKGKLGADKAKRSSLTDGLLAMK